MPPQILVFSRSDDPHVQSVLRHVPNSRAVTYQFSYWPEKSELDIRLSNTSRSIRLGSYELDPHAPTLIWMKLLPAPRRADGSTTEDDHSYALSEWVKTLWGVVSAFSNHRIYNGDHRAKKSKLGQLIAAREAGFNIPETVIGNSPTSIDEFLPTEEFIYKPFGNTLHKETGYPYTTVFQKTQIDEVADSVSITPAIYQRRIHKRYEIRLHVFGEHHFALKIDNQGDKAISADWRVAAFKMDLFSPIEMPREIIDLCHKYLTAIDCTSGVFDLIFSDDVEYCFLECNPGGQWHWATKWFGENMERAMADALLSELDAICPTRETV